MSKLNPVVTRRPSDMESHEDFLVRKKEYIDQHITKRKNENKLYVRWDDKAGAELMFKTAEKLEKKWDNNEENSSSL